MQITEYYIFSTLKKTITSDKVYVYKRREHYGAEIRDKKSRNKNTQ